MTLLSARTYSQAALWTIDTSSSLPANINEFFPLSPPSSSQLSSQPKKSLGYADQFGSALRQRFIVFCFHDSVRHSHQIYPIAGPRLLFCRLGSLPAKLIPRNLSCARQLYTRQYPSVRVPPFDRFEHRVRWAGRARFHAKSIHHCTRLASQRIRQLLGLYVLGLVQHRMDAHFDAIQQRDQQSRSCLVP